MFNERQLLPDAGSVSRESADEKAQQEYERFSHRRRSATEAHGEQDLMRELEDTAKTLPKRKEKPKSDD